MQRNSSLQNRKIFIDCLVIVVNLITSVVIRQPIEFKWGPRMNWYQGIFKNTDEQEKRHTQKNLINKLWKYDLSGCHRRWFTFQNTNDWKLLKIPDRSVRLTSTSYLYEMFMCEWLCTSLLYIHNELNIDDNDDNDDNEHFQRFSERLLNVGRCDNSFSIFVF